MLAVLSSILAATDASAWNTLLGLIAIALVLYAIYAFVKGQILVGVGCLIAAVLIGPGGISLLT